MFLLETNSVNKVMSTNLKTMSRIELISFSRKRSNNLVILFYQMLYETMEALRSSL